MAEYKQYPSPTPRGRHARHDAERARTQAPRHGVCEEQVPGQGKATREVQGRAQATKRGAKPTAERVASKSHGQQQKQENARMSQQQGVRSAKARHTPPAAYGSDTAGGYRSGASKASSGTVKPYAGASRAASASKKGGPWRVLFWIALAIFVVALVALGAIGYSYWKGQSAYDSVAAEVFEAPEDIEGAALEDLKVDWDRLLAINPDTVGWVYIPGTVVNYPIVHTTNDEKYLSTDFNGQQTWGATYGSIFLSAANVPDFSDANNIVYGHHLNNGSMFAAITGFESADQFNAHRTAYILTPQGNFKLRTISLVHVAATDPLVQTSFATPEDLAAYIQDKLDRSVVAVSDAPNAADIAHLFAFSTCDNLPTDGRYVLFSYLEESTVEGIEAVGGGSASIDPDTAAAVNEAAKEAN